MVLEKNFSIMCSEVLEILKYCPKRDVNKIPSDIKMLLNDNKDINHKITINPNKSIFNQPIIEETIIMIFLIFRNYWASQKEKEEIDYILNENEIKFNEYYDYNKMFNQDLKKEMISTNELSKKNNSIDKSINTDLIEYKESFIKKLINILKKFFNK